ncbi:hypothetical protein BGZ98_007050 [Dissophora globulifera]|uniref:AB hydrolase-1 domain-containing protein n=1 Tax=Dissophora globulifera TaxID=979702 RepID=A0A9P6UPW0_9FUNG|nr:hypothetical protein BGZ98_007050 [Dissophora globulifera]KAG0314081.1 hypothetical protein BGZ99_008373 [Dissophora globulifera]
MTEIKQGVIDAKATNLYQGLQGAMARLPAIEAHHLANSKPTAPEYLVSSFNHKFVVARGFKYHYVEEGNPDGEPLLLLHGFPDLWYGLRYQIRHLAKQGYRVIALDNLGSGESDHPRCDDENYDIYRTKNITANIVDILDQLNIPKVVVIGHDCIGIPHLEPAPQFVHPKDMAKKFPQFTYIADFQTRAPEGWFEGNPHTVAVAIYNSVYGASRGTSEKQFYIDTFTRTTLHGALNYYRAARLNWEDELPFVGKPFTVPSLLIVIESDPVVTVDFVDLVPNTTIQTLEKVRIQKGGHNVIGENPEELNLLLDAHLNKVFGKEA